MSNSSEPRGGSDQATDYHNVFFVRRGTYLELLLYGYEFLPDEHLRLNVLVYEVARETNACGITPLHLLGALTRDRRIGGCAPVLEQLGVSPDQFKQEVLRAIRDRLPGTRKKYGGVMPLQLGGRQRPSYRLSFRSELVVHLASMEAMRSGRARMDCLDVLIALLAESLSGPAELMQSVGLDIDEVREAVLCQRRSRDINAAC